MLYLLSCYLIELDVYHNFYLEVICGKIQSQLWVIYCHPDLTSWLFLTESIFINCFCISGLQNAGTGKQIRCVNAVLLNREDFSYPDCVAPQLDILFAAPGCIIISSLCCSAPQLFPPSDITGSVTESLQNHWWLRNGLKLFRTMRRLSGMNADIAPGGAGKETLKVYIWYYIYICQMASNATWSKKSSWLDVRVSPLDFFSEQNEGAPAEAGSRCFNETHQTEQQKRKNLQKLL